MTAVGVTLVSFAVIVACTNFYISFVRPLTAPSSPMPTGFPVVGFLFLLAGCAFASSSVWQWWWILALQMALDTGGPVWLAISIAWAFQRERRR